MNEDMNTRCYFEFLIEKISWKLKNHLSAYRFISRGRKKIKRSIPFLRPWPSYKCETLGDSFKDSRQLAKLNKSRFSGDLSSWFPYVRRVPWCARRKKEHTGFHMLNRPSPFLTYCRRQDTESTLLVLPSWIVDMLGDKQRFTNRNWTRTKR